MQGQAGREGGKAAQKIIFQAEGAWSLFAVSATAGLTGLAQTPYLDDSHQLEEAHATAGRLMHAISGRCRAPAGDGVSGEGPIKYGQDAI